MDLLKWFRKKPAPQEKGAVLGAMVGGSRQSHGKPQEYRTYSTEGYFANPIIYRCIQAKAQAVSNIPVAFYKKDTSSGLVKVEKHPLSEILDTVNPEQTWEDFMRHMASTLSISGEAAVESVYSSNGKKLELYPVRPDMVRIDKSEKKNGLAVNYHVYTNGIPVNFQVDPITGRCDLAFIRDYNPVDFFRGTSPMAPCSLPGDLYNAMNRWNLKTMKNGARPSGVISAKADPMKGMTGKLTPEQRAEAKKWIESMEGEDSAARILLLEDGWEWSQMSMSGRDLDFTKSKINTANDICISQGVPPQILGIPGSQTYANYSQADKSFHQATVIPFLKFILNQINHKIIRWFDEGVVIWFCEEDIPALVAARQELYVALGAADFMTVNEKRRAAGLPDYKESEEPGDQVFAPTSQVPVEDLVGVDLSGEQDTGDYANEQENEDEDSGEEPESEGESGQGNGKEG